MYCSLWCYVSPSFNHFFVTAEYVLPCICLSQAYLVPNWTTNLDALQLIASPLFQLSRVVTVGVIYLFHTWSLIYQKILLSLPSRYIHFMMTSYYLYCYHPLIVVQATIAPLLNYCNSLLTDISASYSTLECIHNPAYYSSSWNFQ